MHVAHSLAETECGLPRPLSRGWTPAWVLTVLALWWITFDTATAAIVRDRALEIPPGMLRAGIAAGVLLKAAGNLAETAFYSTWWDFKGVRIPFGTLWAWLLSLSTLDMLGLLVPLDAADAPHAVRVAVALLCGAHAVTADQAVPSSPLVLVFGPLGALTLTRIGMTAWLQARAAGRRLAEPLGLTAAAWLALRLATWWLSDLARGQSARLGG